MTTSKYRGVLGRREDNTNLGLSKDWIKDGLGGTSTSPRYNKRQKTNSKKGAGLNEHCNDGIVHCTRSVQDPHSILKAPVMQDQPYYDHGRKDDVQCKSDREV